jgi:hypothetical protein
MMLQKAQAKNHANQTLQITEWGTEGGEGHLGNAKRNDKKGQEMQRQIYIYMYI